VATIRERRAPKTWSLLGNVKRKPTPYEVVTSKFHYHFRRPDGPFEHPNMPLNKWYMDHREGSPLQVDDWEGFRDPYKLTYRDYVTLQHDRETYLDKLIDGAEASSAATKVSPQWVATLRALFVPTRFPLHVLQMTGLYVGQMAPSSFITNCANFSAADEMRRIQRIAYWTKVLANADGSDLAATATARSAWEQAPAWQPARKVLEKLLIAYDWGEAFAARNLVVKPALDVVLNDQFGELARRNGDEFLVMLSAEFARDSRRSEEWSTALVKYTLEHKPELRNVLRGWISAWQPGADQAVEGLAELFEKAPKPMKAREVIEAVKAHRQAYHSACGL
jgi:toluene monooxygenase system protein E